MSYVGFTFKIEYRSVSYTFSCTKKINNFRIHQNLQQKCCSKKQKTLFVVSSQSSIRQKTSQMNLLTSEQLTERSQVSDFSQSVVAADTSHSDKKLSLFNGMLQRTSQPGFIVLPQAVPAGAVQPYWGLGGFAITRFYYNGY